MLSWPPIAARAAGRPLTASRPARAELAATAIPALALILFFYALRPVGYHGGGWDDWHYLEAARCAAANGICAPTSHWWTRWPLVAPMGAVLWLFGESRSALWIVPAAYAVAATILLTLLVERQFGRTVALLSSLALVATPVFNERVLNPNADIPELTWILAAFLALQAAFRSGRRMWAAAAGLLIALAIASRPTSVTLIPIGALALLIASRNGRRLVAPFIAAAFAALAIEIGAYWSWTGDALLGWRLSLLHTTIPSSELAPGVDLSRSPLFNIAYIDGWKPAAGIKLHWAIDPVLNLLAHPAVGPTLLLALALVLFRHRELPSRSKRILFVIVGVAALHFAALAYGLAIDPKPRMFLFEAATAAGLIGACGALSSEPRKVTPFAVAGLIFLAATSIAFQLEATDRAMPPLEQMAARWVAEARRPLVTDDMSRRVLALVPGVDRLPIQSAQQRSADVLSLSTGPCSTDDGSFGPGRWRVERRYAVPAGSYPVTAWLRRNHLLLQAGETLTLCLVRRY